MLIPYGPPDSPAAGFPTLYPSRMQAYGAGATHDQYRGCPAQYAARYVDCACGHERHDGRGNAPEGPCQELVQIGEHDHVPCGCERSRSPIIEIAEDSSPRDFGGAIHEALFHMEEHAVGPEDALREVWPPQLDIERFTEAIDLLNKYLDRGGPMVRYGTLMIEAPLYAQLYVDDEFGPVWMGGIVDWLGIDVNEMQIVHLVDYKTNQRPLDPDEVRRDVQLRTYDWLVHRNWQRLGLPGRPHTVAHMDGLRWRDVEVRYTDTDRAQFEEWASAVAHQILRDTNAPEILTPGCRFCPRQLQCSAYQSLPGESAAIELRALDRPVDELWTWRQEAAQRVKTLQAGIDKVDQLLGKRAVADGPFVIGDQQWAFDDVEQKVVNVEALHLAIGSPLFYEIAKVTQKEITRIKKERPDLAESIDACIDTLVVDQKVSRKKVKPA